MKIIKIKNIEINIIYLILGFIAFGWAAWSSIHDITNIPAHKNFINPNTPGGMFIPTIDIGKYTKDFTTFFYFTTLSNIIFGIVTLVRAFYRKGLFSYVTQKSVATYMIITGVVFWTAISFSINWKDILVDFELIFLHLINPIISVLLIIFFSSKEEIRNSNNKLVILKMLSYPLIYYIAAWIFYISISGAAAIYPFIDFYHPFLVNTNVIVVIIMDVGFLILFFIFLLGTFYSLDYYVQKRLKKLE